MRSFVAALFCLICFSVSKAQLVIPLYEGDSVKSPCKVEEFAWKSATGREMLKNVSHPSISVYFPDQSGVVRTAVIVCPGGGYSSLSIGDGGFDAAKELTKNGMVAIVLKYRTVIEECPCDFSLIPLKDVQQAICITRLHTDQWKIDIHKVGLLGFSAGGHLSAMAATRYDTPLINAKGVSLRPDFTILAYPVISFTDSLTSRNSRSRVNLLGLNATAVQKKWFSPERNVTSQTPPCFIIHASNDSTALVENSIAYYSALHRFRIPAELVITQKGGHGFAMYNKEEDNYWLPQAVKWLKLNSFL